MPSNPEWKDRMRKEFRTVLSLTELTTAVNNQGRPTLAQPPAPYRSFDEARGGGDLVLNSIMTLLPRKSEAVAAVACKPRPPASSLELEPNPYEIMVLQNIEPATCSKSEPKHEGFGGASNNEDDEPFQQLGDSEMLTGVANPDCSKKCIDTVRQCILVDRGQSHMAGVRHTSNYWENCFKIPDNDPLVNHIATVEDFVNLHRGMKGQRKERHLMSKQFAAYLVARCYPKMRQRACNTYSEGFIYFLGQVDEAKLRKAVAQMDVKYTYIGRRNLGLIKSVVECPHKVRRYIIDHCPSTYNAPQLTGLISAWQRAVDNPQAQAQDNLYNASICIDFHQLTVATLLAYGKALDELYDSNASISERVSLGQRVRYCAGILWRLAYSGILRTHLEVLDKNSLLHLPTYRPQQVVDYEQFTAFNRGGCETNYPGVGEDDDEGAELKSMMEASTGVNISKTFSTWLRFLASYWEALSISSHDAAHSEASIHITPLAVQCYCLCSCKVAAWEPTINTLIQDRHPTLADGQPIDADAVIEHLRNQITVSLQAKRCHPIFNRFRGNNLTWKATIHCEVALASLVNSVGNLPVDCLPMQQVMKESSHSTIAMSTLCCPVCWELLAFLTEQPTGLTVRGRHANLSQVELPPWLPDDVIGHMLDRFKGLLVAEITTMMVGQSTKNLTRKPLQQHNVPNSNGRYFSYDSLYSDDDD